MWKFCFFALVLYVSCSDAQTQETFDMSILIEAAQRNPECEIVKWSYGALDCNERVIAISMGIKHGEPMKCLFLCIKNPLLCRLPYEQVPGSFCDNYKAPSCELSQWSWDYDSMKCPKSTTKMGLDQDGRLNPDGFLYYTCVKDGCNVCPSKKVYFKKEVPCQKMCDGSKPRCQYRPLPGCGCRGDQFWNGLECVDQCEQCPPGAPHVLCRKNPCKGQMCFQLREAKCKVHFCGGCAGKFYFNETLVSTEICGRGCDREYWVECDSKQFHECPLCHLGCQCNSSQATLDQIKSSGRKGCWYIQKCYLP